jgi:hypothetical protein
MARVKIAPAKPDTLDEELARLRAFDVETLRGRWCSLFGRRAPSHLPRHLLYRLLAYRLQADRLGDLDAESKRALERLDTVSPSGRASPLSLRPPLSLKPGTVLGREWNGQMHSVIVRADGFAWNGTTYPSLSAVSRAITRTRWSGPRFFGLSDREGKGAAR